MQLDFTISPDSKALKIAFEKEGKEAWLLSAKDIEQLISTLADFRQKLEPLTRQCEPPQSALAQAPDAVSPKILCAKVGPTEDYVLLSVAFPGLGWRSIRLDRDEAHALGLGIVLDEMGKP